MKDRYFRPKSKWGYTELGKQQSCHSEEVKEIIWADKQQRKRKTMPFFLKANISFYLYININSKWELKAATICIFFAQWNSTRVSYKCIGISNKADFREVYYLDILKNILEPSPLHLLLISEFDITEPNMLLRVTLRITASL